MGVLKKINPNPVFTKRLIEDKVFQDNKLSVIDVGVRGGFETHWDFYKNQVRLIGFDADKKECNRLNRKLKHSDKKYYPVVLSNTNGQRKFYITNYSASSGFYKPDLLFWRRFPDKKNLSIKKTVQFQTQTLDSFLKKEKISSIDFIKLDVEGAEFDVLRGAEKILKKSVFGLSVEIEFLELHEDQPVFADVDSFVNKLGFKLYDFNLNRIARKTLSSNMYSLSPTPTAFGQILWGQAVYLRDAYFDLDNNKLSRTWDKLRILKLASFMELVNLEDCAIELIQKGVDKKIISKDDGENYIDLLTESFTKKKITYKSYLNHSRFDYLKAKRSKKLIERIVSLIKSITPLIFRKSIHSQLKKLRGLLDIIIQTT